MKQYIKPVCKVALIKTASLMSGSDPTFLPSASRDGNWEAESKSTYNTIWTDDWTN